jgi:hypothetical protein
MPSENELQVALPCSTPPRDDNLMSRATFVWGRFLAYADESGRYLWGFLGEPLWIPPWEPLGDALGNLYDPLEDSPATLGYLLGGVFGDHLGVSLGDPLGDPLWYPCPLTRIHGRITTWYPWVPTRKSPGGLQEEILLRRHEESPTRSFRGCARGSPKEAQGSTQARTLRLKLICYVFACLSGRRHGPSSL